MKKLYESILDTDFDVSIPGENLPGSNKLMSILMKLADGKDVSTSDEVKKMAKKYMLKDLKNVLDNLAKKPVKQNPTKKWAIVCYKDDICTPRTADMEPWQRNKFEDIHIYKLDDRYGATGVVEYMFRCWGNLAAETDFYIRHSNTPNPTIIQRIREDGKYCVPAEVCGMIDYIIKPHL